MMFLNILRMAITNCFLVIFAMFLIEYRYNRKITILSTFIFSFINIAVNSVLIIKFGYNFFIKVMPFTITLPYIILFYILSKYRDFKRLFNVLTVCSFSIIDISIGIIISNLFFNNSIIKDLIVRIISFIPISLFVVKEFKKPCLHILYQLKIGWLTLCILQLFFYGAFYFLAIYPKPLCERPENILPLICVIAMLLFTYIIICILFQQIQFRLNVEQDNRLLEIQVSALQNQSDTIRKNEEQIKIQRHDMKHYINNISALLHDNNIEAALQFAGKFDEVFNETKLIRYCENTTINAILAFYLDMAKQEGINVKTQLDIPETIPVDAIELSTVFANAIENACNACRQLPSDSEKKLEIICISRPQFVFEIANSYCGKVKFDENCLPVTNKEGHGIGTRSIVAFARKNNALIDYNTDRGMFRVRILINVTN